MIIQHPDFFVSIKNFVKMRVGFNWKNNFSRINGYFANGTKFSFKIVKGVIYYVGCKHATCWEISPPKPKSRESWDESRFEEGDYKRRHKKIPPKYNFILQVRCAWDDWNFAILRLYRHFAFLACRRHLNSANTFAKQRWNAGSQPSTDNELDLDFRTTWLVNWTMDFSKG